MQISAIVIPAINFSDELIDVFEQIKNFVTENMKFFNRFGKRDQLVDYLKFAING